MSMYYNGDMKHCIEILACKYPQIYMPIKEGIKNTEEYKDIVLRGKKAPYEITFSKNPKDKLETIKTEIGDVEILSLRDRDDFIHAVRALGNKCEPVDVPDSTGAIAIFGLNNWDKVRAGLDDYKDSLIILSSGNYSNVDVNQVNEVTNNEYKLSKEDWIDKSIEIRKFHELTHFIMRKKYPEDIKPIRDELIADALGLIGAFNKFDSRLLKLFLGIEGNVYRKGGRLENYEGGEIENIPSILIEINKLERLMKDYSNIDDVYKDIEKFM